MDCSAAKSCIFPYVDGELDLERRTRVDDHLAGCDACRHLVEVEIAFRAAYVSRFRPDPAPPGLRQQVVDLLAQLGDEGRARGRRRRVRRFALVGAAVALLVSGTIAGIALQTLRQSRDLLTALTQASVDQHQRLVRGLLPVDIEGVSPASAQAWFRNRLDFNVTLPDLPSARATLLGGRISHLADVEAAALEYRVDGQHVSLFIIPEETYERLRLGKKPKFTVLNHRGYDVIIWRSHGTGYAMVSEIGGRSCLVCHAPEEAREAVLEPANEL
ncbi:MAG: anti-sigma factor family protein [Candidatus Rokuibacteriota bacterium]